MDMRGIFSTKPLTVTPITPSSDTLMSVHDFRISHSRSCREYAYGPGTAKLSLPSTAPTNYVTLGFFGVLARRQRVRLAFRPGDHSPAEMPNAKFIGAGYLVSPVACEDAA